jgi:hypothetical protein
LTHIVHFVSGDVVAVKDLSGRSDDLQVQVVQEHSGGHDGIVGIRPHDGRLKGSSDVVNLDDVGDLLVGGDHRLHNVQS